MASLSSILDEAGLSPKDEEWIHLLVGDWQLVSDLSFADLVLWVRRADDPARWTCAIQVRPNTGPLVFHEDLAGVEADPLRRRLLVECMAKQRIVGGDRPVWHNDMPLREEAIPVMHDGQCLAVLTRHSDASGMRGPSRLEVTYRATADVLVGMIASGHFPQRRSAVGHRTGSPRVGDGVMRVDAAGIVTYASPNVISALHRFGAHGPVVGEYLSRLVTESLDEHSVVEESLPLVLTGRAPMRSEVEGAGTTLALRTVPLSENGERLGALILVRDISELRRREQEIQTKDATIREIHHRVKNNLQTVGALLRLQSRRVEDERARSALMEAERRIGTIALVHETLSRTIEESVDFDEIVSRVFRSIVEVAGPGRAPTWEFDGSFGMVAAEDANALAMVVTELVGNAVEHGLADQDGGVVRIRAERTRDGDDQRLTVDVEDDGAGLPEGFRPGRSGLGTQIVTALVQDLRGTISWQPREHRGTRVRFDARLRPLASGGRSRL